MKKPSVFDFLDAAQFLKSHYDWRKAIEANFSIAKWTEELGLGSKVTLRFILKRLRKISERSSLAFQSNLKLNEAEARYFDALVAYSQAQTTSERQAFGSTLLKLQRDNMKPTVIDPHVSAKHVYGPIILTLLTFKDLEKTAARIADMLQLQIKTVEEILEDFTREKLITRSAANTYEFNAEVVRTPDHPDLRSYYEYWIEQSKKALSLPRSERQYRSIKVALSPTEYQLALEKIDEYALSLLSKFKTQNLTGRRLYMYETCLFPIALALKETVESSLATQEPLT